MLVRTTEVSRDWINALKDRVGRARIQMRLTVWFMAILGNIAS